MAKSGVHRGRQYVLVAGVLLLVFAAAFTALARRTVSSADRSVRPSVRTVALVAAPVEAMPLESTSATPAPRSAAPASPSGTGVTFTIPPQTFVHLDNHGVPFEAMTNTRRPPSGGDQFFVSDDGPVRPLDPSAVPDVLRRSSTGDWSQLGRYVALADG